MSTNQIIPNVSYSNVLESTNYNFNVPVQYESEILIEFFDLNGIDVTSEINYTLSVSKSVSSALFDINAVSIEWVGSGTFPAVNTLRIYRRTSDIQQTTFELGADISVETEHEVDRLTRAQQDIYESIEAVEEAIENVSGTLSGPIDTADISDGAITEDKLADSSVSEDKLINGAVTTPKLADNAVTNAKLADNSVNSDNIIDGSINGINLSDDIISTAKVIDGAITEDKLANSSITEDKLSSEVLDLFDANIPFKLSVSDISPTRIRIEPAEIALNDLTQLGVSNHASLVTFEGIEIEFANGSTYELDGTPINTLFSPTLPSDNEYKTYLLEATFDAINSEGKTPLILNVVDGQQAPILGDQEYPEITKDFGIGFVTVQENGSGALLALEDENLITLDVASNSVGHNLFKVRVNAHTFAVGDKLVPVYWNGVEWLKADAANVSSLATHLIIAVISLNEFILAYSGRVKVPNHGLTQGAFYFLGDSLGSLSLVEAEFFSNPLLQVEDENFFTLLGWRANEKTTTTNVTSVDRLDIPLLTSSTTTEFESGLVDIFSIMIYDASRELVNDQITVTVNDLEKNKFYLTSPSTWLNLRIDLVGVK